MLQRVQRQRGQHRAQANLGDVKIGISREGIVARRETISHRNASLAESDRAPVAIEESQQVLTERECAKDTKADPDHESEPTTDRGESNANGENAKPQQASADDPSGCIEEHCRQKDV